MSEAIRTSLKANGVKIVGDFAPDDPSNVPLQLQQFNEALSLKPDVIIYTAIAPEPSVGLAKAAHDAGIPLVAAQVPIDSEYAVSVTRNTPLAIAQVTAGTVASIGGKGNVLRVDGIPGIPVSTFASLGIDAVLENCPEVKVAGSVTGFFQPATAQAEVQKFLATNPAGVDAVLAGRNDGRRHPQRLCGIGHGGAADRGRRVQPRILLLGAGKPRTTPTSAPRPRPCAPVRQWSMWPCAS